MKIAMIGGRGIPARYGGVERHVTALSEQLARMGHDITAYTRRWYFDPSWVPPKRVRQVVLPSIHTQYLDTLTHTILSTIHAIFSNADVIHFHGVGPALLSWIPRIFKPRALVVVTVHSLNRFHPQWNVFGRFAFLIGEWAAAHFPHRVIAVSHHLRAYFRQRYGRDAYMIPNGIDAQKNLPSSAILKKWRIAPRQYVLFVGRFTESKEVHTLIAAWKELRKKRVEIGARKLALVGAAHLDRAYDARLRRLVGRNRSVVFTGWMEGDALLSFLAHAEVFVQPSATEGMPIALLEAMAYGVPVLVSDIPVHRELVSESATRFPVGDHNTLARLLLEVFSDPEWYEKHGRANQEFVKREYRWEAIARKTEEMYSK